MIGSFSGKHAFLSNFYLVEVEVDGEVYPTVEHAFQASKASTEQTHSVLNNECSFELVNARQWIKEAPLAREAKARGRVVLCRRDWDNVKVGIMTDLVRQKFTKHPDLRWKLIATDNEELVEGNWWGDTYWGVCRGEGENHLGKTLMKIREELGQFGLRT